jgi:hypothetical protein
MPSKPGRWTREQLEHARPALIAAVIAKARRFAADPHAGYAEGIYLRQKAPIEPEIGKQIHSPPSDRSDEVAWAYGVAEMDVPFGYYTWKIIEAGDGSYELVVTVR